jgi:hypothetical protein
MGSVTFLATWVIHKPLATKVMPAISTLRVDNSIKSNMQRCSPLRVHTSTVKKSAATSTPQCWARNSFPGSLLHSFRRRLNAVPFQDCGDRAASQFVPQIRERAFDPTITPIAAFPRHAHHQCFELSYGAWSSRRVPATAIVFLSDQFPLPGQQRFHVTTGVSPYRRCPRGLALTANRRR